MFGAAAGEQPAARLAVGFPDQLDLPLGGARSAEVALYDLRGRRVALLHRGPLDGAGPHAFSWDGRDDAGADLPSGVYFAQLSESGRESAAKLLLAR